MSAPVLSNIVFNNPGSGDTLTGIDSNAPPQQNVVLGAAINQWNITYNAIGENVDLLTIGDFGSSGLSSLQPPQYVVALNGGPTAVYWYIVAAEGAPAGFSTIAWDHDHTQVWTVQNPNDPNSQILLDTHVVGNKNQWFKIVSV